MSALVWHNTPPRYEEGVDRGVLYVDSTHGVPWNGLLGVDETIEGSEAEIGYFDGVAYGGSKTNRSFAASLKAFSYPKEFLVCLGEVGLQFSPGVFFTGQSRPTFGFSYRSMLGDGLGYKIHLVYNATAIKDSKDNVTLSDSPSPTTLSIQIKTKPRNVLNLKPSAHFALDTTKLSPEIVSEIERVLYGTDHSNPTLPDPQFLYDLVELWDPQIIIPQTNGIATLSPGYGDLTKTNIPGVYAPLINTRLTETVIPGIYGLE